LGIDAIVQIWFGACNKYSQFLFMFGLPQINAKKVYVWQVGFFFWCHEAVSKQQLMFETQENSYRNK
jgi:hypothetical protein